MRKGTIVVFNKNTKETLACISLDNQQSICHKDIDFQIYRDTEPIFDEKQDGIVLNENAIIVNF